MPEMKSLLTDIVDSNTPAVVPPYDRCLHRMRARGQRRRRLAGAAAVAVVVGAAVTVPLLRQDGSVQWVTSRPAVQAHRSGAVPFGGAASCAVTYTPHAVAAQTDFAFDGTVTGVAAQPDNASGNTPVRFRVHEWFRGGSSRSVVVGMTLPPPPGQGLEEHVPAVAPGVRMLVSGKDVGPGQSAAHAVAWSCGFTRYYDSQTAAAWRNAMGGGS